MRESTAYKDLAENILASAMEDLRQSNGEALASAIDLFNDEGAEQLELVCGILDLDSDEMRRIARRVLNERREGAYQGDINKWDDEAVRELKESC